MRQVPLALLGIACVTASACGRSNVLYQGDAFGSGDSMSGKGGANRGGGGGSGGSGGSMGGSGGISSTGGTFTTGGSVSAGGSSGVPGAGGSSTTGGAGGSGPYACANVEATCDAFHEFPVATGVTWGNGAFTGGYSVFGAGITRDMNETGLHVTGMVSGYGRGFNLWFSRCSDLAAYTGVLMTVSGTPSPSGYIDFQLLTNSDYPWQARPEEGKGACTAADPSNPFVDCASPGVEFQVTGAPLAVDWAAIMGGKPVVWDTTTSPRELLGMQWLFPWSASATSYAVDVWVDDLYFMTSEAPTDCVSSASAGMGGMGGIGGVAGIAGIGGLSGTAGTAGGSQAGVGNEGGMAGEGGAPSTGGSPDAGFGGI